MPHQMVILAEQESVLSHLNRDIVLKSVSIWHDVPGNIGPNKPFYKSQTPEYVYAAK